MYVTFLIFPGPLWGIILRLQMRQPMLGVFVPKQSPNKRESLDAGARILCRQVCAWADMCTPIESPRS